MIAISLVFDRMVIAQYNQQSDCVQNLIEASPKVLRLLPQLVFLNYDENKTMLSCGNVVTDDKQLILRECCNAQKYGSTHRKVIEEGGNQIIPRTEIQERNMDSSFQVQVEKDKDGSMRHGWR